MASTQKVIWVSSSVTPTNSDRKKTNVTSVTFSGTPQSGSMPPEGSTLVSAKVYFSSVFIYSLNNSGFSTSYGKVKFTSDGTSYNSSYGAYVGHQDLDMYDLSKSALIAFRGGTVSFEVFTSSSSTANVINVRSGCSVRLEVEYVPATASTGELSTTSVMQGETINLEINPTADEFAHNVVWQYDASHYVAHYKNPGELYDYFEVPSNWPAGQYTCILQSFFNGQLVGSNRTYPFLVSVDPDNVQVTPGTLAVSLKQSPYIPSDWQIYVQGYSQAVLSITGASAGEYGATLSQVDIRAGSQIKTTKNELTFTTAALLETGAVECVGHIVNSFGNEGETSPVSINVYEYFDPEMSAATAFRCAADGTPSDHGAYFGVYAAVRYAEVNRKNSLRTLQARVRKVGSSTWSSAVTLTNGVQTIIGGGSNSSADTYQVQIIAIDQVQNLRGTQTAVTITALTSEHVIFCRDGGLNVSFGMEGTMDNAIQINPNWRVMHGDVDLAGTIPPERGGTGATSAAAGLGVLINAVSALSGGQVTSLDYFPMYDADARGAAKLTLADLLTALGFSSGVLPLSKGGTGASTAAGAVSNLNITPAAIGAAASSHNHSASDLNSGTLAAARLPFKFAYGSTSINSSSQTSLNYSGAKFTSTPCVVACYATTGGNASGNWGAIKINAITTTSANCIIGGSTSGSKDICWFAIGT